MSDITSLQNIANNIISKMKGGDYDNLIESLQGMKKAGCGCGGNQLNGGKAKKAKKAKAKSKKSSKK